MTVHSYLMYSYTVFLSNPQHIIIINEVTISEIIIYSTIIIIQHSSLLLLYLLLLLFKGFLVQVNFRLAF